MRVYAFWNKNARGGAFLAVGETIREALQKLDKRTGRRSIMGISARPNELEECDQHFLTPDERAFVEQQRAEALR